MTLSICSGNAPSSTMMFISVPNGVRLRLATKPSPLPAIALISPILRAEIHRRRQSIGRALGSLPDLAQFHDIGRREEMRTGHVLRAFRGVGHDVDVDARGVGVEQRA